MLSGFTGALSDGLFCWSAYRSLDSSSLEKTRVLINVRLMRYLHLSLAEIDAMQVSERNAYVRELSELIKAENGPVAPTPT